MLSDLPKYLRTYIVQQNPSLYTPIDHAGWRYIMKLSRAFFARHAHQKYLDGLRETGISTDRIPLIEEMDRCLEKFGWHAAAVSGFIPPAVFMEFLARGILPIACDMRKPEHLTYTPAPDIVHEAAGHAPIIADPEYAAYLRHYGELAEKAIYSKQDLDVYHAVRALSDIKEDPRSTEGEIAAAQARLDRALAAVDHVTEATQLSRMGWWTIEYGLVGTLENPKIYGAGLLSSVSESYHCLSPSVKKIPFSVECVDMNFDITRPQPQLYLARDFHELTRGLEELAKRMAYRRGGVEGLEKARKAQIATTSVLDSGLQISGTLTEYRAHGGEPIFLKFTGPTQLAVQNREIEGHGVKTHAEGFSTPLGRLQGLGKSPAELTEAELASLDGVLQFESGIQVKGRLVRRTVIAGKTVILAFTDCTVVHFKDGAQEVLYRPEWGTFDLACGERVVSVFGGPADRTRYLEDTGGFNQDPSQPKTNLTEENRALGELYARVRALRERNALPQAAAKELDAVHAELERRYPEDWLLRYELLELNQALGLRATWEKPVRDRLHEISARSKNLAETIQRGLELL